MKFNRLYDMEQYISKNGVSSLEELCRHYNVSMSTIRRDIAELVRRKNFSKVYGGVALECQTPDGTPSMERRPGEDYAQQVIGRLAASLVKDGMSVFLDSGSTTLQILPYIAGKRDITVISHSLVALYEAAKYPALHVIALGGVYNRATSSFIGGNMQDELSKMSIDLVFLSATGVTLERGLTNTSYSEVEIKKTVIKWNRNRVLMADQSHFGHDALLAFCDLKDLSVIVTDQPLKAEYMHAAALRHLRVIVPEAWEQNGSVQAVVE
ncbi:MAG: DeoR/GlpR family DNA-binding transcription regulator [Eubacteriales bacterium]|nr:DeoR/GlpR family DNA-binding transcription regulator [Eubacteriales bacterium]